MKKFIKIKLIHTLLICMLLLNVTPVISYGANPEITNLRINGEYTYLSDDVARIKITADPGNEGRFYCLAIPFSGETPPNTPTGSQVESELDANRKPIVASRCGNTPAGALDNSSSKIELDLQDNVSTNRHRI